MKAPRSFRWPAVIIGGVLGAVCAFVIHNIMTGWRDCQGITSLNLTTIGAAFGALLVAGTWGK